MPPRATSLQCEQDVSRTRQEGDSGGKAPASLGFLSALWRRTAPEVAELSSPGYGGTDLSGRNVFPSPWLSWMRCDVQVIRVPKGLSQAPDELCPEVQERVFKNWISENKSLVSHLAPAC